MCVCVHECVVARKRAAASRNYRASGALAMAEDALQTAIDNQVDEVCLILNPCQIPNRGYGCATWGTVGLTTLAVACLHLHAMGLTEASRRARDILVIRVQQQMPAVPVGRDGRDDRKDYLAVLEPVLAEAFGEDDFVTVALASDEYRAEHSRCLHSYRAMAAALWPGRAFRSKCKEEMEARHCDRPRPRRDRERGEALGAEAQEAWHIPHIIPTINTPIPAIYYPSIYYPPPPASGRTSTSTEIRQRRSQCTSCTTGFDPRQGARAICGVLQSG